MDLYLLQQKCPQQKLPLLWGFNTDDQVTYRQMEKGHFRQGQQTLQKLQGSREDRAASKIQSSRFYI